MERKIDVVDKRTSEQVLGLKGKYGKYEINQAYRKISNKYGVNAGETRLADIARRRLLAQVKVEHVMKTDNVVERIANWIADAAPWRRPEEEKRFTIPRGKAKSPRRS